MKNWRQAFTLVEVLVSLILLGFVYSLILNLNSSSSTAIKNISAEAEILQESQNTLLILSSRIREAQYVFPANIAFSFFSSGITGKNTIRSNSMQWITPPDAGQPANPNSDPYFIAMILPPTNQGAVCNSTITTGCYRFFAYYPILRSSLTNNSGLTFAQFPDPDAVNDDKWVLMEYRKNLTLTPDTQGNISPDTSITITNDPSGVYGGGSARMLADYLAPRIASATSPETLKFTVNRTQKSVNLQFRTAITTQGKTFQVPQGNGFLSVNVFPRNM